MITTVPIIATVATTGWTVYGGHFSHLSPRLLPGQDRAKESPKLSQFSIAFKPHLLVLLNFFDTEINPYLGYFGYDNSNGCSGMGHVLTY